MRVVRCAWMPVLFLLLGAGVPDERVLLLEAGTHKLLREAVPITRVAVGDPAVADVHVINRREVLITARKRGVTSLMVWPEGRSAVEYRLRVGPVADPLVQAPDDDELIDARVVPGQGLSGRLPNLLAHQRARARVGNAERLDDHSTVGPETQVMTEIRIVEVSRQKLKQFGLNILKSVGNTVAAIGPPGVLSGASATDGPFAPLSSGAGFLPVQSAFNIVVGNPNDGLLGVLGLLEGQGLARTLAEPSLVAMSGQTATFLAGGEFPVPVSQSGASSGGITVQYKEFGVRLNLTPTVLSRDRIALKVAPEVSDLDFTAGVQVGGVTVPALTVRRTDTTVELGDGESFVISGLVSNNLLSNVDRVPWLGSIPILGAFFKSASLSREQRELVMIVTPHLVRPMRKEARFPALPGADTEAYDPGYAEWLFTEDGDLDDDPLIGFSR